MEYNFCGFIWSPAKKFTNDILEHINKKLPVLHYYTYNFINQNDFEKSILDIYTTDDIDPKKVKNIKIKNMINHSFSYTYFKFYIKIPNFRKKQATGNNISRVVEDIKKEIRSKYKSKIKNYIHDIIIHISDNFEQTKAIIEIMKKYNKNKISEFINLKYFLKLNYVGKNFDRCDVLVRKYSIEQYLKDEKYDFNFYSKMQKIRTGKKNYIKNFKNLINSIKDNGFNNKYSIKYSKNFLLRDGSHRLSYLLILNKIFIKIEEMKWDNHGSYSYNWFKNKKFTNNELKILKDELNKLSIYVNS